MDVALWVMLIVVVIGAVWWFRSSRTGAATTTERGEFEHEPPRMTHGLTDAVPQPPLVMNRAPESGLRHPPVEPDPPASPAPADTPARRAEE